MGAAEEKGAGSAKISRLPWVLLPNDILTLFPLCKWCVSDTTVKPHNNIAQLLLYVLGGHKYFKGILYGAPGQHWVYGVAWGSAV